MRLLLLCAGVLSLGLGLAGRVEAQGIERESLAGGGAGYPSVENQPYNLKLGPVDLRMDASVSMAFNDNVNVAKSGRIADISLTPSVGLHMLWQVTEYNSLNLDLGIGYQAYFLHSQNSNLVISPSNASQLQYNIFVGDFKINLHDTFSFQQDPLSVGQLSNTAQFARFINSAGAGVDWDLNEMIISLDYEHANLWVFQSAYKYLDNQTDSVSPQVSVTISPTITAGVSASFSDTRFHENIQNNSTSVTFGPFVTTQLSENLSVHAGVGASLSNYDSGGLNGDTSNTNYTYYANVGVSHRVNDVLTQTLTLGREIIPGLTSNYTDRMYANYGTSYQVMPTVNLGASLWWENLDDSSAIFRQTSNRYGVTLSTGHAVTDHSSIGLSYQYVLKVANPTPLGYYQDLVTLSFGYQF